MLQSRVQSPAQTAVVLSDYYELVFENEQNIFLFVRTKTKKKQKIFFRTE